MRDSWRWASPPPRAFCGEARDGGLGGRNRSSQPGWRQAVAVEDGQVAAGEANAARGRWKPSAIWAAPPPGVVNPQAGLAGGASEPGGHVPDPVGEEARSVIADHQS